MVSPPQASNAPDSRMRSPHALLVHHLYTSLQNTIRTGNVEIDGDSLDIPTVVAVSWYVGPTREQRTKWKLTHHTYSHGIAPTISKSPAFINRIADSVALVFRLIGEGKTIYGQQSLGACPLIRATLTRSRRQHRLWRQCRYSLESK